MISQRRKTCKHGSYYYELIEINKTDNDIIYKFLKTYKDMFTNYIYKVPFTLSRGAMLKFYEMEGSWTKAMNKTFNLGLENDK
jgi:hypothetical protein